MKLYTKKIVGEIFSKVKGGVLQKWVVRGPMTIVHGYIYQTLSSVLSHPTRRAGEPVGLSISIVGQSTFGLKGPDPTPDARRDEINNGIGQNKCILCMVFHGGAWYNIVVVLKR